jgi:hypothetical protein
VILKLVTGLRDKLILTLVIFLSLILSVSVYFYYRPSSWPFGTEPVSCLLSICSFIILLFFLLGGKDKHTDDYQNRNIRLGLIIGLLWSIEISVNNFIRPGLPLRDIIDDAFWALVALLILIASFREGYKSGKFMEGLKSGFWTGLASGAVACLSALLLIVFGMKFILLDPLNIREWADIKGSAGTNGMNIYFAYQSFAGAVMHLYILGIIMGLLLGCIGGFAGKLLKSVLK